MSLHNHKKFLAAASLAIASSLLLAGCGGGSSGPRTSGTNNSGTVHSTNMKFSATIKYTDAGVPHITADNLKDAGFGSGYVQAKANACILADQFIRVKGERSQYYGPGPSVNAPLSPYFAGTNVISDFSMKAMGIQTYAEKHFSELSQQSKDLLTGFAAGYDHFLAQTNNLTTGDAQGRFGKCAGKPWVKAISPTDVLAYYAMVARYASGIKLATGATFFANPQGLQASLPHFVAQTAANLPAISKQSRQLASLDNADIPALNMHHLRIGSNGWGIGGNMTESGKGALLANPHFPYTGSRRLFQLQIDVPSIGYNVNGGALLGVAIPLIGYNKHVAWTHTVSTAHHFTVYGLQLASDNKLQFIKDGKTHDITPKTFQIKVKSGGNAPLTLAKTFYYAYPNNPQFGPMINLNLVNSKLPKWGQPSPTKSSVAYTYRDANVDTSIQMMDQWLAMGEATNLTSFKKAFQGHKYDDGKKTACSSVLWVNTMYADDQGNAFYIDATSTPNLKLGALGAYKTSITPTDPTNPLSAPNPIALALLQSGITLLDGSKSLNDWVQGPTNAAQCGSGNIPYAGMPQTNNQDFVQNSNNSFWLTSPTDWSPASNTTGISPLYGYVLETQKTGVTPRTRMGLRMLLGPTQKGGAKVAPAGSDGKFSAEDIINKALYSDRALYAESMIHDLLTRCGTIGTAKVNLASGARSVAQGCAALHTWATSSDGVVFNNDSVGPAVFRVFIGHYLADAKAQKFAAFKTPYDKTNPVTTPSGLPTANSDITKDHALIALAEGLNDLDKAGIAYNTPLGQVQCEQQSASVPPGAMASADGSCIPWPGTQNLEGGFNIVEPYISNVDEDTRYPRVSPQPSEILPHTGQLSDGSASGMTGWKIGRGTSWHFGLEFTNNGPEAYGLVSYSQSADSASKYSSDQDKLFSQQKPRKLQYLTTSQIDGGTTLSATVAVPDAD